MMCWCSARHQSNTCIISKQNQFYAKRSKCCFNRTELEHLGHLVGRNGVRPDPRKVAAVNDWPVLKNVHDVRSFVGLANYFRRFIQGYSTLVAPLNRLQLRHAQ
jgi:hypothetical protein